LRDWQVFVLGFLAVGAAAYIWRGVRRSEAAEERFFRTLVERLSQVLEPKGFRLTRNENRKRNFGLRMATFEGSAFLIDAMFEGEDRAVLLVRRDTGKPVSTGDRLAYAHIPEGARPAVFAQANDAIVAAASAL
jgi:hypothetical protein